jgi:hypothetical protein
LKVAEKAVAAPAVAGPEDRFILGALYGAEKGKRFAAANLLGRLLAEGTAEEKTDFYQARSHYYFPKRFYGRIPPNFGSCRTGTEIVRWTACRGGGECQEERLEIVVHACGVVRS